MILLYAGMRVMRSRLGIAWRLSPQSSDPQSSVLVRSFAALLGGRAAAVAGAGHAAAAGARAGGVQLQARGEERTPPSGEATVTSIAPRPRRIRRGIDNYYRALASEAASDDLVRIVPGSTFAQAVAKRLQAKGQNYSPGEVQGALSATRVFRALTVIATSGDPNRSVAIEQAALDELAANGPSYFPNRPVQVSIINYPTGAAREVAQIGRPRGGDVPRRVDRGGGDRAASSISSIRGSMTGGRSRISWASRSSARSRAARGRSGPPDAPGSLSARACGAAGG